MTVTTIPVGELGTNCYLFYDDNKVGGIIDPGDEPNAILAAVARAGVTVKCVLLTHAHFDHIGALPQVLAATGAKLLVPAAEAAALTDPVRALYALFGGKMPVIPAPDRLLNNGDTVEIGQITLTVLITPGHTPGSSCYLTGRTIFTGDTLFCGTIGRVDFPGGNGAAMRASLRRLSSLPGDYTLYPGHDAATTLENERWQNPHLQEV